LDLNQLISKIPQPILVLGVLIASLVFFVYNNPLKDECEVQAALFEKKTLGLIAPVRRANSGGRKIVQFPKLNYSRDKCKEGNTIGSCSEYLEGLRTLTKELKFVSDKCQIKISETDETFVNHITSGLQIMALVAWGEKPPASISEKLGWLSVAHLQTFCHLKRTFLLIAGEENYIALRTKVYREYPDNWPEAVDVADRLPENRPRAMKTDTNPSGTLKFEEVYSRSLFSVKCDAYM
jgi:hypothetical protein